MQSKGPFAYRTSTRVDVRWRAVCEWDLRWHYIKL